MERSQFYYHPPDKEGFDELPPVPTANQLIDFFADVRDAVGIDRWWISAAIHLATHPRSVLLQFVPGMIRTCCSCYDQLQM